MINRKRRLILQAGVLALIPILPTLTPQAATAQVHRVRRGAGPQFAVGQILLYCQPNTPKADVDALAALVGAPSPTPLRLADCYKLILPIAQQTAGDTLAAVAVLKGDPRVRSVGPNYLAETTQAPFTPSDTLYNQQWGLTLINMPLAWSIENRTLVGNAAVCDSCFDPTHPDLKNQYLSDTQDFTDDSPLSPLPGGTGPETQHGVHVSGTIVAITNNNLGVSSVGGYGATKCLGLKIFDNTGVGDEDWLINALTYMIANRVNDHIVAVNLSIEFPGLTLDPTDPLYTSLSMAQQSGIIVVAAAGNETESVTHPPAVYPFVVSVSATDRNARLTGYSNYGKIDVAAPGGAGLFNGNDVDNFGPDDILSTRDGGYHFEAGTSMACPHVTGLATLLMQVPGVTAQQVFDPNNRTASILTSTANHAITGQTSVPDTNYGFGLIDAYAALAKVSTSVAVTTPIGINPATGQTTDPTGLTPAAVETLRPPFVFNVRNVPLANVNIVLQQTNGSLPIITNGAVDPAAANLVTNFQVTGTTTGNFPTYQISFRYLFNTTLPSIQQTITITGQPADPTLAAVNESVVFTVAPHQFPSGLNMVSIPYYESNADSPAGRQRSAQEILGLTSLTFYRWTNVSTIDPTTKQTVVQGTYAASSTDSSQNADAALASLQPTDVATTTVPPNGATDVAPVGLGYFAQLTSGALVRTYGIALTQSLVQIPLHEGWNMVGDPFPFPVSFGSSEIQTLDGNRESYSSAVQAGLVLPYIYSYNGTGYVLQQLPNGTYLPWQSHWIYVVPKDVDNYNPNNVLTLVIPPTNSASASGTATSNLRSVTSSGPAVSGPGSWSLRLVAHTQNLVDGYNYIGMSSNATNNNDVTKAPKPPQMSPYVTLGLSRGTGGLYAQDLRPIGGSTTWNVVVTTDQKAADISVQWPNIASVPKRYSVILTDPTTGQSYDLRSLPAYQFHATAVAPTRKLTITVAPALNGGRAVISNLIVNQATGRGVGQSIYDISYNVSAAASVDVSISNASGRVVSHIQQSTTAATGTNHAYWDGRDVTGKVLSSGVYTLQVRAQTSEGQVTRQIQTLTITR